MLLGQEIKKKDKENLDLTDKNMTNQDRLVCLQDELNIDIEGHVDHLHTMLCNND